MTFPERVSPLSKQGFAWLLVVVCLFSCMPAAGMLWADVERDFRLGRGRYQRGLYDQAIPYLENVRTGTSDSSILEESLLMLGESYRIGG